MAPWQQPVQQAGYHVDHIGHLLDRAQEALDAGWDTGTTRAADDHLAAIQQAAHRARTALRTSTQKTSMHSAR